MNKTLNYILITLLPLIFISCSTKEIKKTPIVKTKIEKEIFVEPNYDIKDVKTISQNPADYKQNIKLLDKNKQHIFNQRFNIRYFKPWNLKRISSTKKDATWAFLYQDKKIFGQNYRIIQQKTIKDWIVNSNFKKFNSLKQNAITIRNTNLRVFPTNKPMFLDPNIAGEGFPFDYNQNSAIKINQPIFISHFSKDKAWVFVESNFTMGWISVNDIAFVDKVIINIFKKSKYYIATTDNFAIYTKNAFKDYVKLGTIFPKSRNNKYLIVNRYDNLNGYISTVKIKAKNIAKKPILFTPSNATKIASELINEPYGWGGLFNTRDCSSMTRDFFSVFGIYLERNSAGQILNGKYISFKNKTNKQKKKLIIKSGKPFMSLIYLKGHVMLYIGAKDNEPLVFHDTWGIKTNEKNGKNGRHIIGKSVITSLEPGKELKKRYNPLNSLLNKAQGIIILDEK